MLHGSRRAVRCFLFAALAAGLPLTGCGKKAPVTVANSNIRAADDDDQGTSGNAVATDPSSPPKTTDENPATPPEDPIVTEKPSTTPPVDELYTVPSGEPAELIVYLDKLDQRLKQLVGQLRGQAQRLSPEAGEVIFRDLKQLMGARITAAERLLASDKAEAAARLRAVESKIDALQFMEQTDEPDATAKLTAFVTSLKDDADPAIRRMASENLVTGESQRVASGGTEDPAPLVALVKGMLAGEANELTVQQLETAQNAAVALLRSQHVDSGVEVLHVIGSAFAGSSNPQIAEAAQSMTSQAQVIALQHALEQVKAGKEPALAQLLAEARKITDAEKVQTNPLTMVVMVADELRLEHPDAAIQLSSLVAPALEKLLAKPDQNAAAIASASSLAAMLITPPKQDTVAKADALLRARLAEELTGDVTAEKLQELLSDVAMEVEGSGQIELATHIYDAIAAAATKIGDAKALEEINNQLSAANKRLGLIGKPLVVEGKLLDGTPFDWSKYAGKVVLVDFWATWCGPCLREIPNIKQNYEGYHEQGFDVVGVNLDDNNEAVEQFFAARGELPWATVVSPDDNLRGFETPLATQAGLVAIPFVVLVGKDGNVEAIHVRGGQLGNRLAKIFGPPMPKSDVPEANIVPEASSEAAPPEAE